MAAQGYQESELNQNARSPVGAIGIMQIMPATGKSLKVGDIRKLEPNIHAGVKYMRDVRDTYFENEPMDDLNKALFTFASYNAGPGRVRQLRREAEKRGLEPERLVRQRGADRVRAHRARDRDLRRQHLQVLRCLPAGRRGDRAPGGRQGGAAGEVGDADPNASGGIRRTTPIRGVILRQGACLLVATVMTTVAGAQALPNVELRLANASFESSGSRRPDGTSLPMGWSVGGTGYVLTVDTAERLDGRISLRSHRVDTASSDQRFGAASQSLPARIASGRTVRFTGWIRTANIDTGFAGLWLRIQGPRDSVLQFDNMRSRAPRGTTPWTRYVIELPVDSGAASIVFGALPFRLGNRGVVRLPADGSDRRAASKAGSLQVNVRGASSPRRGLHPPADGRRALAAA